MSDALPPVSAALSNRQEPPLPDRRLPVRPDLDQLKHQAKDLLRAIHRGDANALAELRGRHPHPPDPEHAKLADAQLALARGYGAPTWARLVVACKLIDAIWEDDADTVRALVLADPKLLHEDARIHDGNWGPPLSYAANVGRDGIIAMLAELGATDFKHGLDRAVLQSRIGTARLLHRLAGSPIPPAGAFGTPAYTLSVSGTEYLFEIGGDIREWEGQSGGPVEVVLCTDSRKPDAKHRILEMYVEHGLPLPDTPMMALHRGRIDLLEQHLRRDPQLLERTFTYAEIFPPEVGCNQPPPDTYDEFLPRTPIAGTTLLHVAIEFDELEIARWLLDRGMNADARAAVDANGFGGHTALFNSVVSYPNFWMNFAGGWPGTRKPMQATFAELLLDHGADPNARASFREEGLVDNRYERHDYRDVTPLEWARVFRNRMIVSEPAMAAIAARGGR
jgi:ankyrin repeat protein